MAYLSPARIGLVGDAHGNLVFGRKAVLELAARGCTAIHFLGDFGFLWEGQNRDWKALKALSLVLEAAGVIAYVTGGNHDGYTEWLKRTPDADGIRWIRGNIGLLPRGWRATTPGGKTIASLGGANSIDAPRRQREHPGRGWWPEESITDDDLAALGSERVDYLLGHDAPITRRLQGKLIPNEHHWEPAGLAYAHEGQAMFHRGFLKVRPSIVLSGHYHLFVDTTEEFETEDGDVFTARSVVLNAEGHYPSLAVLDADSGDVEFVQFDQEPGRGWAAFDKL